jgi:Na+-transporting NADH:ubiquinone oxidoreductase subunit NqrF
MVRARGRRFFTRITSQTSRGNSRISNSTSPCPKPLPEDHWTSHTGFIHEVLRREYLDRHPDPSAVEYYLCGPQPMIQAARTMLEGLGVDQNQIAFDEF